MKKSKYALKVYFSNPNGTNDCEILERHTGYVVEFLESALFGISLNKDFEIFNPKIAVRHVAVSPICDGTEFMNLYNKYFKEL